MIYFIVCYKTRVCKIGYSANPRERLKTLQTSYPYELYLAKVVEGTIITEKLYHNKYNKYRLNGEWFNLDYIQDLKQESSLNIKPLNFGNVKTFRDCENGYFNASMFCNSLLILSNIKANIFQFLNSNTAYFIIESLNKRSILPYYNSGHFWFHPVLFFEFAKRYGANIKIDIYNYMFEHPDHIFPEIVRIAIEENKDTE